MVIRSAPDCYVPVAVTERSGFDESVHFGAAVALGPDGSIVFSVGDPTVTMYPRSSTKPLQAVAMVRHGLALPPRLLALVCASHSGGPDHIAGVREILASQDVEESNLANVADLALSRRFADETLRGGGGATRVQMNCSGKHAGMLCTCVHNDWPTDESYLDQTHPLQLAITATIAEFVREEIAHIGVDGCGAPAHVMTLLALARGYRRIFSDATAAAPSQVASAMMSHPEMVGGDESPGDGRW